MSGAGFLDIAKRQKPLTLGGVELMVSAISLGAIATLSMRFEPFRFLITRNPAFKVTDLFALGEPVVAALIAASLGQLGNAEWEKKAAELSAGEQVLFLGTLYEVSFPEDVRGPFVEMLERVFSIRLDGLFGASKPETQALQPGGESASAKSMRAA